MAPLHFGMRSKANLYVNSEFIQMFFSHSIKKSRGFATNRRIGQLLLLTRAKILGFGLCQKNGEMPQSKLRKRRISMLTDRSLTTRESRRRLRLLIRTLTKMIWQDGISID